MDSSATLEAIFLKALEKTSAEDRAAYLDQACAGAPRLRQAVEKLLHAHQEAGSFLEPPVEPREETHDFVPPSVAESPGSRIGPYKLLQQIGEGGMGTVFMAEQEQPVRRRVALKIIKPGMDSTHVLARFRAEQQALAMMDHQNIAKVFDAGVTGAGRPYFVMELVHGVPITKYCDDNRLTPRERLDLFVPVCRAMQHAHQKGIIHRDLKPSNVLVCLYDGKPVAKVIDFGVAKAMEQSLTEQTLFTQFGQVIGTLEYMSSEQAEMSQLGIDTRSDIYSLGVMLYELLTGSTPLQRQRVKQAALDELLRWIREEEPPPPSSRLSSSSETLPIISQQRRTEPGQLTKLVRGELDWIVMKALEKDRTRRYDSASGLAQDIERYLTDEPVEACPPSATYRLRKYAHKHRVLLRTAAAFVVLLTLGASISVWQAIRATVAEGVAEMAREDALKDRDQAVTANNRERRAHEEERKARQELDKASGKLRRALYAADMNLVRVAWDGDQLGRMRDLLEKHRPGRDETDLRGFEWYYWKRRLQSETRTVHLEGFVTNANTSTEDLAVDPAHDSRLRIFSNNRQYVALLDPGKDGRAKLKVWQTASGQLITSVSLNDPMPDAKKPCHYSAPSFSPDDTLIVVGSTVDNQLYHETFIKLETGNTIYTVTNTRVNNWRKNARVFFHPDGRRFVTLRSKSEVTEAEMVWRDVGTGMETKSLPIPSLGITFSNDLERFAFPVPDAKGTLYREVHVFETSAGKLLHQLPLPEPFTFPASLRYFPLRFSADGKRLAVGPAEKPREGIFNRRVNPAPFFPLTYWDLDTAKPLWTRPFPPSQSWYEVLLSPDGRSVLVSHIEYGGNFQPSIEKVLLLDGVTGREVTVLSRVSGSSLPLADRYLFSPDSELIVVRRTPGFIVLAARTGLPLFEAKYLAYGAGACFNRDGTRVMVVKAPGTKSSWETTAWLHWAHRPERPRPTLRFPFPTAVHEDGKWIVSLSETKPAKTERWLNIHSARSGELVRSIGPLPPKNFGQEKIFQYVDTIGPGIVLTVPTKDGFRIDSIDPEADRPRASWTSSKSDLAQQPPTAIFLPEGKRALVMENDADAIQDGKSPVIRPRLVDLTTGVKIASGWDHIKDLGFSYQASQDGRTVAFLCFPEAKNGGFKGLLVAETESGRILYEVADIGFAATEPWLSPDGRTIVLSGFSKEGGVLQMHDVLKGSLRFSMKDPGYGPLITFSPSGKRLCFFDQNGSGKLSIWDDHGNELLQLTTDTPLDSWPVFSRDGYRLLAVRSGWETMPLGEALEVIDATPLPGDLPREQADRR